jgi:hypothetical protein
MGPLQQLLTRSNPTSNELDKIRLLSGYLEENQQLQVGQDLSGAGFPACRIMEILRDANWSGERVEYRIADRYGIWARVILNMSLPKSSRLERWDTWDSGVIPPPVIVSPASPDVTFRSTSGRDTPLRDEEAERRKEVAQACSLAVMSMDFLEDRSV